ncbi:MAG TPA: DNA topoisomerase, partial [Polyangia bacterium]
MPTSKKTAVETTDGAGKPAAAAKPAAAGGAKAKAKAKAKATKASTPKSAVAAAGAGKSAPSKGSKAKPEGANPVAAKAAKAKALTGKGTRAKSITAEVEEVETARPRGRRNEANSLVIVESPAKAKTIKKYLGAGYIVKASVGHVKDLPKKTMGIDIEHGFAPEYVVIDGKKKVLAEIMQAAAMVGRVLLAPDPDREGEAIAWHIAEEVRSANPNIQRVLFNEITKKAIQEAIGKPMALDVKKFESQQARRILDRLVGYQISPVLWTKVKRGLSAGRVQSVAVRLVAEREQEITAFRPEEYWTVEAL